MKKIISLITVVVMLVLMFPAVITSADNGDVEISFKVGDSTLLINGSPVTVVTPYLVGDGTTLVPVRVITEAFGANVDWDNDTRTAILEYEGVKILLQIGNKVAEVNGKAETLLAAPELTNGSTMVPLRFISETFNAVVTYDEKTEGITVVKKATDESSTVVGLTDSKYVGDSYYGWTMEKPADMQMDYRSFDGSYVSFMYDDDNYIEIDIYPLSEDYDLEEDFAAAKESMESFTLIKAEKMTASDYKKIHVQGKNQLYFFDDLKYITDKYEIYISGIFKNENAAQRDEWVRTLSTFEMSYKDTDTYDLSNAKNGTRTYEAKDIKLTFEVPQEFYMSSSEYSINEFDFYSMIADDTTSSMHVNVYSKSDVGSAKQLAEYDYNLNKKNYNPAAVIFSKNVYEKQYNSISAYEYTFDYTLKNKKTTYRDVFFELGEYVYNFSISLGSYFNNASEYTDKLINSIDAETIDASEVGMLLRNLKDTEGTYKSEIADFELTVPKVYAETIYGTGAAYIHTANGTVITCSLERFANMDFADVKEYVKSFEKEYKSKEEFAVILSTSEVTLDGVKYAKTILRETTDEGYAYYHLYAGVNNSSVYTFAMIFPEIAYSDNLIKEAENIIKSVK